MCLYVDYDGSWEDFGSGSHVARVDHKCLECNRTITPGERYHWWKGVYDGDFQMSKMCAHCWGTIELGAGLTGCPKQWNWEYVHDLDMEIGFVGNCLEDEGHDLGQADRYRLLRTVIGRRQQWRTRTGDLLPLPAPALEGAA